MTYYLALFTVGMIDRILTIIDNPNYNLKKTEFLWLVIASIICLILTFFSFKNTFHKNYDRANVYAWIGTFLSYFIWWLSKWDTIETAPSGILGGPIE